MFQISELSCIPPNSLVFDHRIRRPRSIWFIFHRPKSKFADVPVDTRGLSNFQRSFCMGTVSKNSPSTSLPLPARQPPDAVNSQVCARGPVWRVSNEGRKHLWRATQLTSSLVCAWTSSCEVSLRGDTWKDSGGACVAMATILLTVAAAAGRAASAFIRRRDAVAAGRPWYGVTAQGRRGGGRRVYF